MMKDNLKNLGVSRFEISQKFESLFPITMLYPLSFFFILWLKVLAIIHFFNFIIISFVLQLQLNWQYLQHLLLSLKREALRKEPRPLNLIL